MPDEKHPAPEESDEPVKIDLDPEEALKALLKVDPSKLPPPDEDEDRDS
jgi:hypothetical protein